MVGGSVAESVDNKITLCALAHSSFAVERTLGTTRQVLNRQFSSSGQDLQIVIVFIHSYICILSLSLHIVFNYSHTYSLATCSLHREDGDIQSSTMSHSKPNCRQWCHLKLNTLGQPQKRCESCVIGESAKEQEATQILSLPSAG